jgi:hypothetical protein
MPAGSRNPSGSRMPSGSSGSRKSSGGEGVNAARRRLLCVGTSTPQKNHSLKEL